MRTQPLFIAAPFGLAAAALVVAGPLNPPAGPVAPTFKTLAEVEPRTVINASNTPGDADATPSLYKITAPGSYYLTGTVTGAAGKIGVEIAADDVSIDLGGFALQGVPGSLEGIRSTVVVTGLTVRNGTVRGWGESGIGAFGAKACRVENITAVANGNVGISAGESAVITGCAARGNDTIGISGAYGSVISACTASENGAHGISGDTGSSFSGCAAMNNGSHGFSGGGTGSFVNCSAWGNDGTGFVASINSTLSACTAYANGSDGFWLLNSGTASGCTSWQNGRDGFLLWYGASVHNSQASQNGRDGIRLDEGDGAAVGNNCWRNGTSEPGAGIRATLAACRIDSNQVNDNDYGIIAVPDCLVVRNSARGNGSGNYSFPLGSEYGQIITNPGNGFVATNPWANFAY